LLREGLKILRLFKYTSVSQVCSPKRAVTRRELRKSPLTTLIITRIYVGERYLCLKQLSVSEREICL